MLWQRSTVRQQGTTLTAGNDLTIESEQHLVVQSGELHSDDTTTLKAGGVIALTSTKNLEHSVEEKSKKGLVWQKAKGEGKTDETVVHTEITAENLTLEAGQGIQADIKAIDGKNLQQTIQQLSQNPELAWMAQLDNNPDVNWQQVQEIHDSWDYESQGLTGPAAALVAIAVAWAVGPVGYGLVGGGGAAAGTAATTTGFSFTAAAGAAQTAVSQALISQATVSLINNQGNIGAVLNELGSSDSIKGLITTALTAGALQGFDVNVAKTSGLENTALEIGKKAVIQAGVDTAINGGSLGDNLANRLITGVVDAAAAETAGEIGDSTEAGSAANIIAHTALGCAAGAARGDDCGSGALGGAVSATVAPIASEWVGSKNQVRDVTFIAEFSAGLAALATGKDVNAAANAAKNEAVNNYLSHQQIGDMLSEVESCQNDECKFQILGKYAAIDKQQQKDFVTLCEQSPEQCSTIAGQLQREEKRNLSLLDEYKKKNGNSNVLFTLETEVVAGSNQATHDIFAEAYVNKNGGDKAVLLSQVLAGFAGVKKAAGKQNSVGHDSVVNITSRNLVKDSKEYEVLNNPDKRQANTTYQLDNGDTFTTNSKGLVEELTFTPTKTKVPRDSRQTAAGKKGRDTDVGGHAQACSQGGSCNNYNLFPQDANFNNSSYKVFYENKIKLALNDPEKIVGPTTIRFSRKEPDSARPDTLDVTY